MPPRDELLTSPLNRIPEGLLDFFSIKSMGEYPQSFNQELRGTLDLFRWYADLRSTQAFATVASIVGPQSETALSITSAMWLAGGSVDLASGAGFTQVPQNEMWIMLESTAEWVMGTAAAAVGQWALTTVPTFGSTARVYITDQLVGFTDNTAAARRAGARVQSAPKWLLPGSVMELRGLGADPSTNNITISVSCRLIRLLR